jgi:hypothetical protein
MKKLTLLAVCALSLGLAACEDTSSRSGDPSAPQDEPARDLDDCPRADGQPCR